MKNWNQDISYEKPVSEWMGFDHEIIGKMMINHGDVEGCIPTFRHSHNWKSSKVDVLEDENPPSRKKSHRICCWPVSRHPHPKGWGGPLATLKGCAAHLYRSCIPGAVRHWHRGIAGHGHGTDGGSTRHHIWRWGVNHLRSTSVNHVTNSHQLDCYTTWDNQQILELVYTTWEFNGFFP